jgi:hypothetical protein
MRNYFYSDDQKNNWDVGWSNLKILRSEFAEIYLNAPIYLHEIVFVVKL